MLLVVVNVDWGRKSRLLCVQDLLRQFEARRESTVKRIEIISLCLMTEKDNQPYLSPRLWKIIPINLYLG